MSVTKDTMDCYRVRAGHGGYEWATICVREWDVDGKTVGESRRYLGEILIFSSFGSWGYQWGHLGYPFRQFLIKAEFDYVFTKLMASELRVFDGEGSFKELLRKVLEERRAGYLDKEQARELWDALDEVQTEAETSERDWVEAMTRVARDIGGRPGKLLQEPWEMCSTRYDHQAVGFWRDIWSEFTKALKEEMEAQTCRNAS